MAETMGRDTGPAGAVSIEEWDAATLEAHLEPAATILRLCVLGGASVNFLLPFGQEDALRFWRSQLPALRSGERHLLVARLDGEPVGTVMLTPASQPNQPHRGEIGKLLVRPDARRLGIARHLMQAAETLAVSLGRTLLILDTEEGSPAQTMYERLGYREAGRIPGYALGNDGKGTIATVLFYKNLAGGDGPRR
ncbi:GNAT family N-acetyltransferase [Marinivivus vitaminiproducens]|uniref:GNAT family N-acetyltransferase n=1 Tax=Marinivivus vitaminiproducens TaxID=3035935 RepID=UPI0027A54D78|nr:GNAT family N-acetyltransferase [Geminicoccaceae bacterium SCSIO 64248]